MDDDWRIIAIRRSTTTSRSKLNIVYTHTHTCKYEQIGFSSMNIKAKRRTRKRKNANCSNRIEQEKINEVTVCNNIFTMPNLVPSNWISSPEMIIEHMLQMITKRKHLLIQSSHRLFLEQNPISDIERPSSKEYLACSVNCVESKESTWKENHRTCS